jgi:hypothetical protein
MPTYQVYYARQPTFRPSGEFGTACLTAASLPSSHVHLCEIDAASLGDAFWQMQGENWSPHGEARGLLEFLGLGHTSMSVGDVLQDEEGVCWECLELDWRRLKDGKEGEGHVLHEKAPE